MAGLKEVQSSIPCPGYLFIFALEVKEFLLKIQILVDAIYDHVDLVRSYHGNILWFIAIAVSLAFYLSRKQTYQAFSVVLRTCRYTGNNSRI